MLGDEPAAYFHQAGQYELRRRPWWVLGVLARALAVVEMGQDRLITAGASRLAMTFLVPPPVSQVSISILNTRLRRCAKGSLPRGGLPGAHQRSPLDAVRDGPGSLARADDGGGRQLLFMAPW